MLKVARKQQVTQSGDLVGSNGDARRQTTAASPSASALCALRANEADKAPFLKKTNLILGRYCAHCPAKCLTRSRETLHSNAARKQKESYLGPGACGMGMAPAKCKVQSQSIQCLGQVPRRHGRHSINAHAHVHHSSLIIMIMIISKLETLNSEICLLNSVLWIVVHVQSAVLVRFIAAANSARQELLRISSLPQQLRVEVTDQENRR